MRAEPADWEASKEEDEEVVPILLGSQDNPWRRENKVRGGASSRGWSPFSMCLKTAASVRPGTPLHLLRPVELPHEGVGGGPL